MALKYKLMIVVDLYIMNNFIIIYIDKLVDN